ncbi:MAG: rhomboid family intramembrane serine protease [Actinomycetota bacterium]|nr:rhomboid family intramembrane serine protease [Actinomycetota bacterium]
MTSRLPVTFGLIAACVAVYLLVAAVGATVGTPFEEGVLGQPGSVLELGALVPALVAEGEAWRLVTSAFLHSGFLHLAINMISLYFLGSFAEIQFGSSRFLALYFVSGIAGGLAYLYFDSSDLRPAVGASGAIFGLLGGVFGFALRRGTFSLQNPIIAQLLLLTALNLFLGASIPNVSNTAHVGGLVGGLVYGWLFAPTVYSQKKLVAATPIALALGLEAILLGVWYLYFA